jgi:DNA-binding IclR family transcriptional regulator
VISVLNALAAHPDQALTLTQLATAVQHNKATLHQVLSVLTEAGYLLRDSETLAYRLGPALVPIGMAAAGGRLDDLVAVRPVLRELSRRFGEAVVSTVSHREIVVLARAAHGVEVPGRARDRSQPYAPPMGAIFAAFSPDPEAWIGLAGAPAWPVDRIDSLRASLAIVRERGFSVAISVDPRDRMRAFLHDEVDDEAVSDMQARVTKMLREMDQDHYLLDVVDPAADYRVDHVTAAVVGNDGTAHLALTVVNLDRGPLSGRETLEIAVAVRQAASELAESQQAVRTQHGHDL